MARLLAALAGLGASCAEGFGEETTRLVPARVLFIGNSYTSVNDLPGLFRSIAASTGVAVPEVKAHAPGGQTLAAHARDPACHSLIDEARWDVVVLQGQSQEAALAETVPRIRDDFLAGGRDLCRRVWKKSPNARILLYQTWARHPDHWNERTADLRMGASAAEMLSRTCRWYDELARAEGCTVAPVGEAWMTNDTGPEPCRLHGDDLSHPRYAGSYLAGLVIYGVIYRPERLDVPFRGSLSETDAERLQSVADEVVRMVVEPPVQAGAR